ncbi:MAG: hypothetical protein AAF696_36425, partial [Bacteroidota bacterium]
NENEPTIRVQAIQEDRFRVFFQGEESQNVWLRIYDRNRVLLYSEAFKGTSEFAKLYNLANLPEGIYFLEFSGKGWKRSEKVELGQSAAKKEFQADITTFEDSRKVILKLDNPEIKEVFVYVQNKWGEYLFNDMVQLNEDGSRTFRFEGYPQGAYTFWVKAGKTTQTELIRLR